MDAEYISLAKLAQNMGVYESMPVPIQQGLRKSIKLTIITNLICIPILILTPIIINNIGFVTSDGFFIWFTADVVNFLLDLTAYLSKFLLVSNVLSLLITIIVLLISHGMTKPVHEPVHWLGWIAAFPSGVSAISLAIMTGLFIAILIATVLLWIVIISLFIGALLSFLSSS